MAESLDYIATELESAKNSGKDFNLAVRRLLTSMIREFQPVLFDGDNYSQDWVTESERRGLPNLRNTVDCLPVLTEEASVALFEKYRVYTASELHGRQEILAEIYCTTVGIEASTMLKIAQTMILPAVMKYKTTLQAAATTPLQQELLRDYDEKIDMFLKGIKELQSLYDSVNLKSPLLNRAVYIRDSVLRVMFALRVVADYLESHTDDDLWPLPTYSEMLFLR